MEGEWVLRLPFQPAYTQTTAAWILGVSRRRVYEWLEDGVLTGPNSTGEEPVDHEALVALYRELHSKREHEKARKEVQLWLETALAAS